MVVSARLTSDDTITVLRNSYNTVIIIIIMHQTGEKNNSSEIGLNTRGKRILMRARII